MMNAGIIRHSFVVLGVVAITLVSGCEDDERVINAGAKNGISRDSEPLEPNNRAGRKPSDSQDDRNTSGDDEAAHGLWRVIVEGSDSADTNWFLVPPPTTVDADSLLDSAGNYMADGYVFTNCDELGFYLISRETAETLMVTNCGTPAFP